MSSGYSPIVENPRPVPWPLRALEAALAAGAVGVAMEVVALGPPVKVVVLGLLLLGVVVTDAGVRTRYAGKGLERSFVQLVVGFFTVLLIALVVLVIGTQPPLPLAVATMLGVGVLVYVVLHWDQGTQVRRARIVADRRSRSGH